jgi:hypothetical protein
MIKRYLARRENPWELLAIAALVFFPGVIMLLQTKPMVAAPMAFASAKYPLPGQLIEVISPKVAHVIGILAITFSALVVVLYFWIRQAITSDPSPHVVEHGHTKSSNQADRADHEPPL